MAAVGSAWLGQILADVLKHVGRALPTLLYAEMLEGAWSAELFVDEGNRIVYDRIKDNDWNRSFYDHWIDLPAHKRWSVMRLLLAADRKFTASFSYPDEVEVSDMDPERRGAAVRATFGDKPIHYPPLPDLAFDLTDAPQGFDRPLG